MSSESVDVVDNRASRSDYSPLKVSAILYTAAEQLKERFSYSFF